MFKRDNSNHLVVMQDDSARELYDVDDFVVRVNNTFDLADEETRNSPAKLYRTKLMRLVSSDEYNTFVDERAELRRQMARLIKDLLEKHLPVILPDAEYFMNSYKEMQSFNAENHDKAINRDSLAFAKAVHMAIEKNKECARAHGIPIPQPKTLTGD